MEWQLKHGKNEEYLREIADRGRDIKVLDDKPALNDLQLGAFDSFFLLSPGRPLGYGCCGGIPTTDIILMAATRGFDPEWFLRVVRAMDSAYLEHVNKRT
jgi:hypothetical protein